MIMKDYHTTDDTEACKSLTFLTLRLIRKITSFWKLQVIINYSKILCQGKFRICFIEDFRFNQPCYNRLLYMYALLLWCMSFIKCIVAGTLTCDEMQLIGSGVTALTSEQIVAMTDDDFLDCASFLGSQSGWDNSQRSALLTVSTRANVSNWLACFEIDIGNLFFIIKQNHRFGLDKNVKHIEKVII